MIKNIVFIIVNSSIPIIGIEIGDSSIKSSLFFCVAKLNKLKVIIDIDVQNPEEVIKSHRGELMGMITGMMLSKDKKKIKVERAICNEMVSILQVELPKVLKEELIEAKVNFTVEEDSSSS